MPAIHDFAAHRAARSLHATPGNTGWISHSQCGPVLVRGIPPCCSPHGADRRTEEGNTNVIHNGVEEDEDVQAALAWFAAVSGSPKAFVERLVCAQQAYRTITASPSNLGQNPNLGAISQDVVGAFLAQAKSLLDDRRSYDPSLASQIIPWVKQIGRNVNALPYIPGANERAARMLRAETVAPDGAMLELVMASNYAADGFDVAFIEEAGGRARTPDQRLSASGSAKPIFVEYKRLKRGQYEIQEEAQHKELFLKSAELIYERRLSVHVDVTYTQELREVPDRYLADCLMRALSSPIITQRVTRGGMIAALES